MAPTQAQIRRLAAALRIGKRAVELYPEIVDLMEAGRPLLDVRSAGAVDRFVVLAPLVFLGGTEKLRELVAEVVAALREAGEGDHADRLENAMKAAFHET